MVAAGALAAIQAVPKWSGPGTAGRGSVFVVVVVSGGVVAVGADCVGPVSRLVGDPGGRSAAGMPRAGRGPAGVAQRGVRE
jgi:hypothetical protein